MSEFCNTLELERIFGIVLNTRSHAILFLTGGPQLHFVHFQWWSNLPLQPIQFNKFVLLEDSFWLFPPSLFSIFSPVPCSVVNGNLDLFLLPLTGSPKLYRMMQIFLIYVSPFLYLMPILVLAPGNLEPGINISVSSVLGPLLSWEHFSGWAFCLFTSQSTLGIQTGRWYCGQWV